MKKLIAIAIGAAAIGAGTAASAQDLGSVIANIFGLGTPNYYYPGAPAVVAPSATIYADQFGRRFYYDQYGRQVYLSTAPSQIVGYDSWGWPIYGSGSTQNFAYTYRQAPSWDRDGDGIANSRDRWPSDPRYW